MELLVLQASESEHRVVSPVRQQEALQSFLLPYYSLLILEIIDKLYYLFHKNDRSFVQNVCDFYEKYDQKMQNMTGLRTG